MKKDKLLVSVCGECGSIHVQQKAWVNLNGGGIDDFIGDDITDFWCEDCQTHPHNIDTRVINTVNGRVRVEGYQVEDDNGNLHPEMEASFCLYSLEQARKMMETEPKWHLCAYYKGDVEEPTLMFKGKDPRKNS